jgi:indoleamine 2,3-dioxygenase
VPPFLSYANYVLYNFHDCAGPQINGTSADRETHLICAFERGYDRFSSEAGFVLTHVDMVRHSPTLVRCSVQILDTIASNPRNRTVVNEGFRDILVAMKDILECMERMSRRCKPEDFASFQTFLFGTSNRIHFSDSATYASEAGTRRSFRGLSGLDDSMLPLLDYLCEVHSLHVHDCRPQPQRLFLKHVKSRASVLKIAQYACEDLETGVLYTNVLGMVHQFRWRHWILIHRYIDSTSEEATGPAKDRVLEWLAKRMLPVLNAMEQSCDRIFSIPQIDEERKMKLNTILQGAKVDVDKALRERKNPQSNKALGNSIDGIVEVRPVSAVAH